MLYFSINLSKWIHNFFPLPFTHSVQYHNNHCSTKQAVFSVWCWPVSFKNLSCQMLYPFQHQECCLVRNVLSLGSETMISTCRGKTTITDALGLEHSHGGGKWPNHQITLLHTTCMFEAESLVSWQGWVWVSRTLQYGELGLLGNATTTAMHGWGSNHACYQWKCICKDLVTSSCGAQSLITTYSPLPQTSRRQIVLSLPYVLYLKLWLNFEGLAGAAVSHRDVCCQEAVICLESYSLCIITLLTCE